MAQAAIGMDRQPVPGVNPMNHTQIKWQRRAVLAVTILPLIGLALAIGSLWGAGFSAVDAGIFVVFYFFTGFGVTVGFHRLLTHRSFKCGNPVRYGFAIAGSMALEGSVISWVADHRRHHAFSDQEGDPHSPHVDAEEGFIGMMKGLWHAHVGWMFKKEATERARWAPDMLKDPTMVKIDRAFPWLIVASLVLPAAVGGLITWSISGAITAFLWGGLARMFLLHHVTWSINSICHFYGKRPHETTDESTNNWPLAIISMGESWHNNHHAFPSSAIHGLERWQIDTSGILIRGLEKMKLVWDVKVPKEFDASPTG
jgi:stearoyl-CoA desaturase (delta-9 desaturase)